MEATSLLPIVLVFMHLLPLCVCDTAQPSLSLLAADYWLITHTCHPSNEPLYSICALGYPATHAKMQTCSATAVAAVQDSSCCLLWGTISVTFAKNLFTNCCFPCASWSFLPSHWLTAWSPTWNLQGAGSPHPFITMLLPQPSALPLLLSPFSASRHSKYLFDHMNSENVSAFWFDLVNVIKPSQSTVHTRMKIKANKDLNFI